MVLASDLGIMAYRLRHCVECPQCRTRYLMGFSPFGNGSYLVLRVSEYAQEYKLICWHCQPPVCSRWDSTEIKIYAVSKQAYARGYGSPDEVSLLKPRSDGYSLISIPSDAARTLG
jgi:hypothetical protein